MEHRHIIFEDGTEALIADLPGQMEITFHGPSPVQVVHQITKDKHDAISQAIEKKALANVPKPVPKSTVISGLPSGQV